VLGIERAQLLVARDQKRELRLERRSRLPLVKPLQERIIFRLADALRVLLPTRIGPSTAMYRGGSKRFAMIGERLRFAE
jgi:hypothetical protein